jgi:sulfur carrier protein ThiS
MSECPSITVRNARKHFVKCVDCGCQTLPQNTSKERPWTAAASLYIRGRANDGALCFNCANKRRENLGPPWEQRIEPPSAAPECQATLKHVCINTREYSWTVSTLESLLTKWHDECLTSHSNNREIKFWIVAVNNEIIPAARFSSTPISDGDSIFIAMGAVAGG